MLLKLGIRSLKNNRLMNALIILQMAAVFVILISAVSTVVSRFEYYLPLKKLLNSNGYFFDVSQGMNPETGNPIKDTSELHDLLEGEDKIIAQYMAIADYEDFKIKGCDDGFINIFTPELESGRWFDTDRPIKDTLQVVVSKNDYGIGTGDVISLSSYNLKINDYEKVKAKVVGVLKDDAKIIFPNRIPHKKADYRNIYTSYKLDDEKQPLMMFRQEELLNAGTFTVLDGSLFVSYKENVAKELVEENNSRINSAHTRYFYTAEEIKKNSLDYIFSQLYDLMPICICILILTLVGAASTSALSAKQQLKNYAVFYICGLKWKQCAYVNFFSALVSVLASFVLSLIAIFSAKALGILGETVIDFGIWQMLGCTAVMAVYILLSIILPISIVGKNTPNQILKSN